MATLTHKLFWYWKCVTGWIQFSFSRIIAYYLICNGNKILIFAYFCWFFLSLSSSFESRLLFSVTLAFVRYVRMLRLYVPEFLCVCIILLSDLRPIRNYIIRSYIILCLCVCILLFLIFAGTRGTENFHSTALKTKMWWWWWW